MISSITSNVCMLKATLEYLWPQYTGQKMQAFLFALLSPLNKSSLGSWPIENYPHHHRHHHCHHLRHHTWCMVICRPLFSAGNMVRPRLVTANRGGMCSDLRGTDGWFIRSWYSTDGPLWGNPSGRKRPGLMGRPLQRLHWPSRWPEGDIPIRRTPLRLRYMSRSRASMHLNVCRWNASWYFLLHIFITRISFTNVLHGTGMKKCLKGNVKISFQNIPN